VPKVLAATFVFAFAFASAVPTSAQGKQNPPPAPSTKPSTNVGPALPRIVHAPLVRSEELPYAEIALNNRSPQPTEVTLTFYSKNGEPAEPVKRTLQPGEVKHIDVEDLLPAPLKHQRELGGVFVQYTGQWNQVALQLTLISADRKSSIDQPLRPDTDFRSGVQDAVWYMPGDAAIVLGNTSGERIIAILILPDGESKEVRLRPYETEIIRLHRDSGRTSRRGERVQSVRVETSAPAGALRAVGYVTFRGFARTIRFYDRATVRQPDLFAANLSTQNSEIQIVLKNISDNPLSATPRFLPVGPGAGSGTPPSPLELPAITLAPGEEALVDTTPLEQLAAQNEAYSRVGVHVRNSGEKGTLIGSLASFNRRERLSFEIPLRDSGSLRNSGGSYPIRLDDDYSTYVSLMNVSNETVEFTGIIRHPKGEYVFKPRKLQAGESALFDVKELRDKKTPDPNGKVLPADFERGQFNWSMHQGGTVPKLIGRSQIVSKSRGVSSSYSCPICCPNSGPYYEFDPNAVLVTVDGFNPFGTNEMTVSCYGVWSGWAKTISLTSMNPAIATSSYYDEGQANAYGHTPGSTDLTTGYYCNEVYTDDGMDCYSSYPCNNQANAPVDVTPTVTIGSFSQNPILLNNTANVQVTVNPSATITLTITSSGTGRATFGSSGNTTMQIPETTTINIRGDAASSSGSSDLTLTASDQDGVTLATAFFSVTSGACNATYVGHTGGGHKACPTQQVQLKDTYNISNYCNACQFSCQAVGYDSTFTPSTCESVTIGVLGSLNQTLGSNLTGSFIATDCNWHNVQIMTRIRNAQGIETQYVGGAIGLKCNSSPNGSPCP
jgi:hypothetical protein